MEEDDILTEDIVTLTRGQWEDLMRSIQSLSLANAKLVETIAFLLKQSLNTVSEAEVGPSRIENRIKDIDPYDLAALRKMIEGN